MFAPLHYSFLQAPEGWQTIDLLSDLHLCEDTPAGTAALIHHLHHTPAQAVLLLGDIFEVWIGDDVLSDPHQPESQLIAALAEASRGRWVAYMPGNRDFLVGQKALQKLGWHELADPCVLHAFGQHLVLSHGDALCTADTDYQRFRQQVRSQAWQDVFLARPLPQRRAMAREMRQASMQHQRETRERPALIVPGEDGVDLGAAAALLSRHHATDLIHGHTHHPISHEIGPHQRRHVLSDWALDHAPFRADLIRLNRSPDLPPIQRIVPAPWLEA
jgi:UDP-2,3-diacylglucosamine hydrolase